MLLPLPFPLPEAAPVSWALAPVTRLVLVTLPLTACATVASPTDVVNAVLPAASVVVATRVMVSVLVVHVHPLPQGPHGDPAAPPGPQPPGPPAQGLPFHSQPVTV